MDIKFPLPPMEATSVAEIPAGPQWQYEPKWDGFRCLALRDGKNVTLQSKAGQPLGRYFPELEEAVLSVKAQHFLLDGEIVVPIGKLFSFDDLLQRIHPAASRVKKLAAEHPAWLIVFDLLADDQGKSLLAKPWLQRRAALEGFFKKYLQANPHFRLSPATPVLEQAGKWYRAVGTRVDGIIAKRVDLPYAAGERGAMQKIKVIRSADCVVGGFRYAEKNKLVGSLLLGLYDDKGILHHVGFCSGLKTSEKPELTKRLEKLVKPPGFTGRAPGGPSRWSTERSSEWQPLKPQLVVEVAYDHVTGQRFRHGTRLLRWRPDKAPASCTLDQLQQKRSSALDLLGS